MGKSKPRLPRTMTQKQAIKLLKKAGWKVSIGGKHSTKMIKDGRRPVTLPTHNRCEYSVGLTTAILKQAGPQGDDDE